MESIMQNAIPTSRTFKAVQSASIQELSSLSKQELRTILPCLARSALCSPLDVSDKFRLVRKEIQRIMSGLEAVNSIVSLLSVDFQSIREDALKEQQLRKKLGAGSHQTESILTESKPNGSLLTEFESSEPSRRIRLVLSEFLRLCNTVTDAQELSQETMELFECSVYFLEISDIICIAFAELPDLFAIKDVAEAFLKVKYGPWHLCRLVGNTPDCFQQVCTSILSKSSSSDESTDDCNERMKTLKMLCKVDPSYCKSLRSEAISRCKLPGLAIELSVSSINQDCGSDIVPFLSGLLLTSDIKFREWFADYLRAAQKDNPHSSIHALRAQLLKDTWDVINRLASASQKTQDNAMEVDHTVSNCDIARGVALMRLYCALKGTVGYKISNEESDAFLQLITCHPPPTSGGVRFVVVGLCALLACTFIINNADREDKATQWIQWLCSQQSVFGKISAVNSSFGEVLLLIAIHFHSNNLEAIVDLVNTTLCMKLRPGSLTKMRILFTQQLFPEKVAAEHVLGVPVTKNLNASISGFLPVHCVHQLLQSRVFTKHRVVVKDWIYNQICSSTSPLHPSMVPLINAFVHSIISPIQVGKTGKLQKPANLDRFSEQQVMQVFRNDRNTLQLSCTTTAQLLMLLYALSYQDYLLENMATLVANPKCPKEYSAALYAAMPIKQLFLKAREKQTVYENLYPPILRIVTKNYPHLCLVEDCMFEETIKETAACHATGSSASGSGASGQVKRRKDQVYSKAAVKKALCTAEKSWPRAVLILAKLEEYSPSMLVDYAEVIVDSLIHLLDEAVPRKVQTLCCSLWLKLNTEIPRRLWLRTVNVLCCAEKGSGLHRVQPYTDEEITKDPLIILRCDQRIFRCAPLLDVLLRVLSAYMDASRAFLTHHLKSHPVPVNTAAMSSNINVQDVEREELKNALITAQESAIVQILMEVCLPMEIEKKALNSAMMCSLREIQCRICSFLHQVFIADPNMVKLVHFQGYPAELLSVTVAGVPSMHICLDFIPELINMPQLEKQLFAVQLLSYLCLQYPIPKSKSIAIHAINRLTSLSAALPAKRRTQFFQPIMPCLERICRAFPPVREEVTQLLIGLGHLTYEQLNKDSSLSLTEFHRICANKKGDNDPEDVHDNGFVEDGKDDVSDNGFLEGSKMLSQHGPVLLNQEKQLFLSVQNVFASIAQETILGKHNVFDGEDKEGRKL
eukprot:gene14277-15764_t